MQIITHRFEKCFVYTHYYLNLPPIAISSESATRDTNPQTDSIANSDISPHITFSADLARLVPESPIVFTTPYMNTINATKTTRENNVDTYPPILDSTSSIVLVNAKVADGVNSKIIGKYLIIL